MILPRRRPHELPFVLCSTGGGIGGTASEISYFRGDRARVAAMRGATGGLCYSVEVMGRDSAGRTGDRAASSSSMLSVMLSISRSEQVEMDGQQRLDRLDRNGSNVFTFRQVAENAGTRE